MNASHCLKLKSLFSKMVSLAVGLYITLTISNFAHAGTERVYNLNIQHKTVNYTGRSVNHALAINGSIPAPTLRFKKGDIAVINVKNETSETTTLHWHGVLLPWEMDGPDRQIQPGQVVNFRFPIIHTGTFWYHSHTLLHEQSGLYGSIVIEDETNKFQSDHDRVVVLSDWTDENPMTVLRNLKGDGDYYTFKKKSFPSVVDAIKRGEFWDYAKSEWTRMGPMDLSDVGYDAFLANGMRAQKWSNIKPNEKVRLRVINAGASTYFYLNLGNLRNFRVISKDGVEVVPVAVNEILMGMGETYDILFTMPNEQKGLEFRATAQDITGYSRIIIGQEQNLELVPDKIRPSPYKMGDHSGHGGGGGGSSCQWDAGMSMCMPSSCYWDTAMKMCMPKKSVRKKGMRTTKKTNSENANHKMVDGDEPPDDDGDEPPDDDMPTSTRLSYDMLKSPTMTEIDPTLKRREITLEFTGDMNRYTWYINGKPFSEEKYIPIKYNEVVRFIMVNKTMMHHPMHLHGHFFRLLNGQDENSPNIHTVDVGPMATVAIEFWANEPGNWFFHCHNLYHMEMGMARLVKYEGFKPPAHMVMHEDHGSGVDDATFFPSAEVGVYTNHAEVNAKLNGGRWDITLNLELDKYDKDTFQGDVMFKRYLSQYIALVGGGEYEDQEMHAILGMAYTVPLNVQVVAYTRSDGKSVVKLSKSIPIYNKFSLDLEPQWEFKNGKTESEFASTLNFQYSPKVKVGAFYKNDNKFGNTVGLGIALKF